MKKGEQNSSKQEQGTVANRKVKKMEKRRCAIMCTII